MDNRKLGQLEVSPIGMGCMGFSHGYGQVKPSARHTTTAARISIRRLWQGTILRRA